MLLVFVEHGEIDFTRFYTNIEKNLIKFSVLDLFTNALDTRSW